MKKQVKNFTNHFSLWNLDGLTVAEIITSLQQLPQDLKLDIDIKGEYENDSYFYSMREETDGEYEDRLKKEEQQRLNTEAYEKRQLENLKKKYETE